MKQDDTQSIAIEVRGITCSLENLKASRERHDKRANENFEAIDTELKTINRYVASSEEFKRQLLSDIADLKGSVTLLTAMSNQAKGGWWAMAALSTVFSVVGSGLTLLGFKIFR